jgi:translocator protein
MKNKKTLKLVASIALCHLAGVIGSFFTRPAIAGWYASLNKPLFSPPNWLFAPAWLTLYTLMGIALYLIWQKGLGEKKNKFAFYLFLGHLAVNALWSIVFFGLRSPLWAFVVIFILWLLIIWLTALFFKIDKRAAYLLVPYWLWVSFASLLNFSIWYLN